jgi:PKD repeat protein
LNGTIDPSGSQETVATNASGDFAPTAIWTIPSGAALEKYDIVADNQGAGTVGTFDNNDSADSPGFQGFSIVEPPPAPVAAFTSNIQSGTAPLTVNFTDQSTNSPTSWAWDFDNNGSIDSYDQNPTHVYSAGTYTVKLTATNAGGSDDEIKTDYISVEPSSQPDWDLNGDHVCNIGDVVKVGLKWGLTGTPGWIPEDLNNDGVINIGDIVKLGLHWGETW